MTFNYFNELVKVRLHQNQLFFEKNPSYLYDCIMTEIFIYNYILFCLKCTDLLKLPNYNDRLEITSLKLNNCFAKNA